MLRSRSSRTLIACLALVALVAFTATPAAAQSKEQNYQQMLTLAQQMAAWKPQLANPAVASQYAAALAQYQQISDSMGGDDPGHVLGRRGSGSGAAAQSDERGGVVSPPGCADTATAFTNATPVPIVDVGVSTSTIAVAGLGPYTWTVTVDANITHTFAADMDITLQSPAGTVVTLSTDNGAGNDDVFDGTNWDDTANPGGQVPYTTNNGVTTDHAYVNLTTATPLVPEEGLWAFQGENPNGTWTLTVSDDLGGDTGSMTWSITVTTFPVAPIVATTPFTQATPTAILDVATVSSTLAVSGVGTALCGLTLSTNITHTFAADMDITLANPGGLVTTLSTDNGAGNDNVFNGTLWDINANPGGQVPYTTNAGVTTDHPYVNLTTATPLTPEESFGLFSGTDPNGTWTMTISDDLTGDTGSLDTWTLNVTTCTCAVDSDLQITKTGVDNGGQIVYTLTVINNGPDPATGVVVSDTLPAGLTYVSDDCGGVNTPPWSWNIGNLANAASVTCNITLNVDNPGTFVNIATVTGAGNDPVPGNNSSATTVSSGIDAPAIPTLSGVGLLALLAAMAGAAVLVLRRRG